MSTSTSSPSRYCSIMTSEMNSFPPPPFNPFGSLTEHVFRISTTLSYCSTSSSMEHTLTTPKLAAPLMGLMTAGKPTCFPAFSRSALENIMLLLGVGRFASSSAFLVEYLSLAVSTAAEGFPGRPILSVSLATSGTATSQKVQIPSIPPISLSMSLIIFNASSKTAVGLLMSKGTNFSITPSSTRVWLQLSGPSIITVRTPSFFAFS
mmetsp:Transcript_2782/g.4632  ORF Transcript_2782/g.4632 Transcript_2782/m.4632 type:complete len:207 (+) Transcript_2782:3400-4020(+)